ncbi:regulation of nuclear pre-mRNA domain-containing protein 2 [Trichonephila inaurata madagascariensis]|uniref:Regulation of nuclear pre-mRNA domain-containing protein 2 n=1 Tax=Trichonephila inaurata madagascariensis TaxID=2747483 RepID=A0A8X6X858_9ARAC|nr:regulation of nuclear pre-mRNA domain-containing protein 2 [Trichonephila inaurata madagascariensis]
MPKELNIEKLEKKFASLTKSRESIQAVSGWIMHYKDCCEEIVEQWYNALSKDANALVMFYVANDVIQNCGKKKATQYREAFSKVLEKAVFLEKVKEIKSDVSRLLSLWKDRNIYDEAFSNRLENKLNSTEIKTLSDEEEESELEIISKYKTKNFINSLKKLKSVESEMKEKEENLKCVQVPEIPEWDELKEPAQCVEVAKKINSYYSFLQQYLEIVDHEVTSRKTILKELKNSCIFYTAQYGDVRKVANAYFMYGKKLKIMEKKLTEKAQYLPSPVINGSPCFSDGICASPTNVKSPADSCSRTSTKVPLSPSYEKDQVNLHGCTFSGKLANNDFSENFEEFTDSSKRPEQAPKKKFNKLAELFSESKLDTDKVKRYNSNELPKSNTNKEMLTSGPLKDLLEESVCEQNNNISELKSKNMTNQQTEEPINKIQQSPHKKMDTSNQQTKDISNQLKKGSPIKSTENITAAEGDANEIDFLLEESYDSRKVKPNTSIKRKIEFLLNSRGKKICTDTSSEQISDDKSPVNNPTPIKKSLQKRRKSSEHIKDHENNIIHNFKEMNEKENVTRQNKIISQNLLHPKPEEKLPQGIQEKDSLNFNVKENIIEEQKPIETCNLLTLTSDNMIDCENSNFPIDKNISHSSSNDKDILGKENKEINLSNCTSDLILKSESLEESIDGESLMKSNNSFLNSTLLSFGSSLSVEFLKDIFQKTNCNPPSDVLNNNSMKEPLKEEDKINSTEVKDCGSSFYNLKQSLKLLENMDSNDHIKNISLVDTKEIYSNEENPSSVDTITPQTEVQENLINNEINVLTQEDSKTDAAEIISYDRMSQNPDNSESVEGCKLEIPFLEKECEENNENGISSESSPLHLSDQSVTLAANEKPDLLFTLQNVLHCIAEKKFSNIEAQNSVQGTTMSFEDCLKIYHALNYDSKVSNNPNSSNSHVNLTSTKTSAANRASSDFGNKDDLEVMDMECDSDE